MTGEISDVLNAIQSKLRTVQSHLEGYEDCTERILCNNERRRSTIHHIPSIQFKLNAMKKEYQPVSAVPEHAAVAMSA